MPNRRASMAMTEEEQRAFLAGRRTLQVASIGPNGYPHLAAMWYAVIDGRICFTTYEKSQKVLNLRRDPKITVMLEDGDTYDQLRGLVIEGNAELIAGDPAFAARVSQAVGAQRSGQALSGPPSEQTRRAVAKRVVIRVNPVRVYSWDHRKLGGTY
jgi:PPOX class probable F420-dependent enzyme